MVHRLERAASGERAAPKPGLIIMRMDSHEVNPHMRIILLKYRHGAWQLLLAPQQWSSNGECESCPAASRRAGGIQPAIRARLARGDQPLRKRERRLVPDWLVPDRFDGVLARIETPSQARAIRQLGVPAIDLRGALADSGLPFIGVDNSIICRRMAHHLRSLGLEHFAFYARPPGENRFQDERCRNFAHEIETAGHRCDIFPRNSRGHGSHSWRTERRSVIRWLKSLPKPVGVMAPHDEFAHQLLEACHEAGIEVPGEVAIAGVDDDSLICNLGSTTLTSIDVGSKRIGYRAAHMLDAAMRGQMNLNDELFIQVEPGEVVARESTKLAVSSDPITRRALIYIRDHAAEGISVRDVMLHVGSSQRSLERKLKQAIGRTPHQEIMRVRMDLAKQLMISTNLPLQDISFRCGFGSYNYFSDAFEKHIGKRPSAYREEQRRMDQLPHG